jgi:hypothetical protein
LPRIYCFDRLLAVESDVKNTPATVTQMLQLQGLGVRKFPANLTVWLGEEWLCLLYKAETLGQRQLRYSKQFSEDDPLPCDDGFSQREKPPDVQVATVGQPAAPVP